MENAITVISDVHPLSGTLGCDAVGDQEREEQVCAVLVSFKAADKVGQRPAGPFVSFSDLVLSDGEPRE